MSNFKPNPILRADSYKASHYQQYPEGTEYVSSYIEARGFDALPSGIEWEETVFLGVQAFVSDYLSTPITYQNILEAEAFTEAHGVPFNKSGWEYILDAHGGYLPLKIEALPEGTVIGLKNCLVQMMNTDPNVPWLTSYMETALLRSIWYPTTVATQSREIKKTILKYLERNSSSTEGISFMLHDFGARGVSSSESAGIGGFAHLVNFMGTDTMEGIMYAQQYYNTTEMPAYSVTATEHSTVTSWGREAEEDMYRNLLAHAKPGQIVSCVSDSYDIYEACKNIWGGSLRNEVIALGDMGSRLVVRPDSGDPTTVPVECVEILADRFSEFVTVNDKGYKVLPDFIRVLQGDGINQESIECILGNLEDAGFAAENMVFGMGGALLQGVNRDTLKFAMKASAIFVNGEWRDVYKEPVHGGKTSKRGRLMVSKWDTEDGVEYRTHRSIENHAGNQLKVFYEKTSEVHRISCDTTLDEIRERASV